MTLDRACLGLKCQCCQSGPPALRSLAFKLDIICSCSNTHLIPKQCERVSAMHGNNFAISDRDRSSYSQSCVSTCCSGFWENSARSARVCTHCTGADCPIEPQVYTPSICLIAIQYPHSNLKSCPTASSYCTRWATALPTRVALACITHSRCPALSV
jgi:hypothetical protein